MRRLVPPHIQAMASSGEAQRSGNGAALILDAEGSTNLAARLQPYGTEGAEVLADILTTTFSPMVQKAMEYGGSVAEIAGDGVLALFPGRTDEAVARATTTAWEIIDELRSASEFDTPAGRAALVFRAVIGAGTLDSLIWWCEDPDASQNAAFTSHGSAVDEARRGELITPGGVISAGPTALSHLSSIATTTPISDGFSRVEEWDVGPVGEPADRPEDDAPHLRFFPPSITGADLRGEFRDVVAVFFDLQGGHNSHHKTEMAHVLSGLASGGGYLNHVIKPVADSDALRCFSLWGAPTSREHDVEYALRFLDDLLSNLGVGQTGAGVTMSVAFAGFVGGAQSQYTAIGPGINLAARMCSTADWGEILVDQHVTSRLSDPWSFENVGLREFKGFSDPIGTYRVTVVPPGLATDHGGGPLVGRVHELDHLEDLLAPLWSGRSPGVIAITGDPGIGKTSLVNSLEDRLTRREPAPTWIHAQADEIRSQPLATLRDAMSSYFGRPGLTETAARLDEYLEVLGTGESEQANELVRTRSALGDLLDLAPDVKKAEALDPKTRFENLAIAISNLIGAIESEAPVIISISDGQWLDGGTADIVRRVTRDLGDKRASVIIESRSEPPLEPDHVLELGAMGDEDIAELLLTAVPDSDSKTVSTVTSRAGGNPFFAVQLAEYIRREGDNGELRQPEIPLDMRRLLVARLDDLPPEVRRLVQTASVLGRDVDLRLLEQMPGGDRVEDLAENAIGAGIWDSIDETHAAFSSSLMREAAYGMLLHSDLRELHGAAASAIEGTSGSEGGRDAELAHHHDRAGHQSVAATHYIAAGRAAALRFDNHEALAHYHRALELIPPEEPALRFEALRNKHDVHELEGDRASQTEVLDSMEEVPLDAVQEADLLILRARLLISLGDYREAERVVDGALRHVTESNLLAQQGALTFLKAQIARHQGRIADAVAFAEDARELFLESNQPLEVARVDDSSGGIAWESGDFEAAAKLHRSAADTFANAGRVIDEVRALNNLGTAIFSIGDYSTAREIHREGAERSREVGYRMGEGDHLDNMGGTAWAVWDLERALEYYTSALKIREAMDDLWGIAISKGNMGAAYRAMGKPQEGLVMYRQALEVDEEIGRRRGQAYDLHGIGLCQLDLGRNNLAVEALQKAAEIREELDEPHLADESNVARAVALSRRGDTDEAVTLVEAALAREGEVFFSASMETTASRLRCIEVLRAVSPDTAESVKEKTREDVLRRADRISDPQHRQSYLDRAEAMLAATDAGLVDPPPERHDM